MTEFEAATAAVQAALDAGARYADARVMVRRYESMHARNGEVEQLTQDEDAGIGEGLSQVWDTAKCFVSSDGHRIDQRVLECGAGIMAPAIGDGETQRR